MVSTKRQLTGKVGSWGGGGGWFPTPLADILAAALTRLSGLHWRKVAVKKWDKWLVWQVNKVMSLCNTAEITKCNNHELFHVSYT